LLGGLVWEAGQGDGVFLNDDGLGKLNRARAKCFGCKKTASSEQK
jgi:hypothetical protein